MATIVRRGDKWRGQVRRKGYPTRSQSFPTRALARIWADRIELELATAIARGEPQGAAAVTIAELIDWYWRDVGKLKRMSKTQAGNLTRIRQSLGSVVASRLTVAQIVEFVRNGARASM